MATYKYSQFVTVEDHAAFDALNHPATQTPWSGIYRCEVCARECSSTQGHPLPPQNHHEHPQRQPILWRLIACASHHP
jgi:hypothetical protein